MFHMRMEVRNPSLNLGKFSDKSPTICPYLVNPHVENVLAYFMLCGATVEGKIVHEMRGGTS